MRRATATVCATACALAVAATQAGCGTTSIVTTNPSAKIYVNGEYVGQGTGEIRKRGAPGSTTIVVKTPGGATATKRIKRRFTGTTFLLGFITYLVGWGVMWEYPGTVVVPVDQDAPAGSSWDGDGDAWSRPPPGWQPPAQRGPSPAQPQAPSQPAPDQQTPAPGWQAPPPPQQAPPPVRGGPPGTAPVRPQPAPAPSKSWGDAPDAPR